MFVANEYVAACWCADCSCTTDPGIIIVGNSVSEAMKASSIIDQSKIYPSGDDSYLYVGTLGNSLGCAGSSNDSHTDSDIVRRINAIIFAINQVIPGTSNDFTYLPTTGITGEHHHLTVTQKGTSNGPNAS